MRTVMRAIIIILSFFIFTITGIFWVLTNV